MNAIRPLLAAAALLLSASATMAADAPPAGSGGHGACKADVEKLCPGVQPGEGRLKACMKEHAKELSPECKKDLASARKARKG